MSDRGSLMFLDATAQAELVRSGEVTPLELVEAAIGRIEGLNPSLNAVVTRMYDEARETAMGMGMGDVPEGPFRGVPFLLKDLGTTYAGVRLTDGSAFMRDFVPKRDNELVLRLKRAGLITVGKTNTPEFGLLPTTESRFLGACHNPWDTTRTPGGSSGGAAAAVAAGFVAMAHASDGGGSIRIPASCCGVFGLKPTRARNPAGPNMGDVFGGLVNDHVVTRSVRDSAALLDAVSGPDVGDPYWAPPPQRPFVQEVGADPGQLRIAFTTTPFSGVPVHPDCVKAAEDAATLCSELGHHVEEAAPRIDGQRVARAFGTIWAAGCAWSLDGAGYATKQKPTPEQVEPLTWALYERGHRRTAAQYLMAVQILQKMGRDMGRFFQKYDILLTPTLAEPPVPLGEFDPRPDNPLHGFHRSGTFSPFTAVFNGSGQPAMSVPLLWNHDGLPIGTQFVGRFGDEATLFRLAAQLEQARPWATRRAPGFA